MSNTVRQNPWCLTWNFVAIVLMEPAAPENIKPVQLWISREIATSTIPLACYQPALHADSSFI